MILGLAALGARVYPKSALAIVWISIALGDLAAAAPTVTGFIVGATQSFGNAFATAGVVLLIGIFSYVVVLGEIASIPEPR